MGITMGWDNIRLRELKKQKEKLKDELSNKKKLLIKNILFLLLLQQLELLCHLCILLKKT